MSTPRDLLNAAKAEIREIDPHEVAARLDHYTLLDVREPDEHEQGAVPGAVHLPRGNLEFSVEGRLPDKHAPIAVYCAGGVRSAFATKTLQDLGYTDVVSITGGFNKWKDEGLVWDVPPTMTQEQRIRYHRHILLPEVGEAGQMKLLNSKVLLLGAGGFDRVGNLMREAQPSIGFGCRAAFARGADVGGKAGDLQFVGCGDHDDPVHASPPIGQYRLLFATGAGVAFDFKDQRRLDHGHGIGIAGENLLHPAPLGAEHCRMHNRVQFL